MDKTYGRNRQSIADIERELCRIFEEHPNCQTNESGEPVVPGDAVFAILKSFEELYNGYPLLSEEETGLLQQLIDTHKDIQISPPLLLQLVAEKTKASPPRSPMRENYSSEEEQDGYGHTRTLSTESSGSAFYQGSHSRPPSRGPTTPSMKSPLDSDRRQRSTPLNNAPSSWAKRPTPAGRRKSDAGNRSDSESGGPPVSWNRGNRARTPSNPASPSSSSRELGFSPGSPDFGRRSRPHSRSRSQPQGGFNNSFDVTGYSSPDDNNHTVKRPGSKYGYDYKDAFENAVSTLPMPRAGSDSDEEDMDDSLVHDRSIASSTVSMEISERLEALQRTNEELVRKRLEAEKTLQNKLTEHELELEETHQRLEELRSELSASNREEKELRAKDSRNMGQIAALEAEVAKVQKALDSAKATYSSLQRQYQEQCSVSERYRDDLRKREETIRSLREAVSLHEIETGKWAKEHESYEERISQLESELSVALEAHTHLDEQKQENMLLKETIDRMRFDMDEMRNAMTAVNTGGSGHSSATNTMSKSLGAELANANWDIEPEESPEPEEYQSEDTTVVEDDETEEEAEDVIQTIITKRKRKVASRAEITPSTRLTFDEIKEYSDSGIQYDPTLFAKNHGMQTESEWKPTKTSFSIQTDEIPQPKPSPPSPPRIRVEMEIQTEEATEEHSRSPSPVHDDSMASSSSTIVPPTPKPPVKQLDHLDEPPAYNQVTEADKEEREWRVAAETLKKWHHGVKIPFEPVAGGVSEEAVEEWKALKQELGVECTVIDKIIASSDKSPSKDPKPRRNRFYNIYNTYVYGDKNATSPTTSQVITYLGVGALAVFAVTPYIMPRNSIPGGVTYADRAAWSSFNSMPGAVDAVDGTSAVLEILRRLTGGAARYARGWPT